MSATPDLSTYRASEIEKRRTADLLRLMPARGALALDVGARDGFFSHLMAQRFDHVVALDLERPQFEHPDIECVAGDAAALKFPDGHFDFVLCAEVLEHVPPPLLEAACSELARVCRGHLLIGVPDQQDLRVGRSTCTACGLPNPPWGHVNAFDESRLKRLFAGCSVEAVSRVGLTDETTNALSAWLMDRAGNPYGTYEQDEPCVHCGRPLGRPPSRNLTQKILTRLAFATRSVAGRVPRGNWIHMLFARRHVS